MSWCLSKTAVYASDQSAHSSECKVLAGWSSSPPILLKSATDIRIVIEKVLS